MNTLIRMGEDCDGQTLFDLAVKWKLSQKTWDLQELKNLIGKTTNNLVLKTKTRQNIMKLQELASEYAKKDQNGKHDKNTKMISD